MKDRKANWLLLFPIAIVVVALDQVSKSWVLRNIPLYDTWTPISALSKILTFQHVTNTGAAFGMFRGASTVLLAIAVVAILAIIVYTRFLSTDRWLVLVSLGLQLGGAIGNLTDRVRLGHVVDFIKIPIVPNFNVADSSLVIGVALLAWVVLTEREEAPQPQQAQEG